MTRFEQIKSMSIDEIAEKAVRYMQIFIRKGIYMSLLDATAHDTEEQAIAYNKKFLKYEVGTK